MQTLENLKEFVGIFLIKPGSVIPHKIRLLSINLSDPKLNFAQSAFPGEFKGIAQQIIKDQF